MKSVCSLFLSRGVSDCIAAGVFGGILMACTIVGLEMGISLDGLGMDRSADDPGTGVPVLLLQSWACIFQTGSSA